MAKDGGPYVWEYALILTLVLAVVVTAICAIGKSEPVRFQKSVEARKAANDG